MLVLLVLVARTTVAGGGGLSISTRSHGKSNMNRHA